MRLFNVLTWLCLFLLVCLIAIMIDARLGWTTIPSLLPGVFRIGGGTCYDSFCEQWYEITLYGKLSFIACTVEIVSRVALEVSVPRAKKTKGLVR